MYIPFAVLLVPFWAGLISGGTLMMAGHVLMFPAMAAVMLRRRGDYAGSH
jgi:flagellar biosynthetic protein FliP